MVKTLSLRGCLGKGAVLQKQRKLEALPFSGLNLGAQKRPNRESIEKNDRKEMGAGDREVEQIKGAAGEEVDPLFFSPLHNARWIPNLPHPLSEI